MNVLLLGASGRIGMRITNELLNRGHAVTGTSRSGKIDGVDDPDFLAVAGDATDADQIAQLAADHDAVAFALGPSDDESPEVLVEMFDAVVDRMRRASVDRFVWTGGAGILNVGPDTRLIDSSEFPEKWEPVTNAAIEAYSLLEDADGLGQAYVAPAAFIEPGEHTGEFRTAHGELVADEDDEGRISMEDLAITLADELGSGDAVHEQLAVGY